MNVKQISRALHTLSLLSNEDYDLVLKFRALTEDERGLLVMVLEPSRPAGKKAATERKIEHCVACDYTKRALVHKDPNADGYHEFQSARGEKKASKSAQSSSPKSPRASGMAAQLNKNLKQQRQQLALCAHVSEDGDDPTQCGEAESSGIHDPTMGYRDYHPFSPAAPPAPALSPANGGAGAGTVNSGTQPEDAGSVAHGASGGS